MDGPGKQIPTPPDRGEGSVRDRIVAALIALMSEGKDVASHDAVAERAAVGRRTVYRYFPDRDALRSAAWDHIRACAPPPDQIPETMEDLLSTLESFYDGLEARARIEAIIRSTPQGRALRLEGATERIEHYRRTTAEVVRELPPAERDLATAVFAALHAATWLDLRDEWELDGRQIARATAWALRALMADLKARGALSLNETKPLDSNVGLTPKPNAPGPLSPLGKQSGRQG